VTSLPLGLQVTGIVVGILAGTAGTLLGVLNQVLRRHDTKPDLPVEAKVEPISATKTAVESW
jgi:hypothetical protein